MKKSTKLVARKAVKNTKTAKVAVKVVKTNVQKKTVSRTEILRVISTTGGRFFTSTHIGKDQKPHVINGIRLKKQNDPMGYIKVYSTKAREERKINPQTVTDLVFQGIHYRARK